MLQRIYSLLFVHKIITFQGNIFGIYWIFTFNNIHATNIRISSMVEKLAQFYGEKICDINGKSYYTFPYVNKLAEDEVEQQLRENGFGYRAKYINHSAAYIVNKGGQEWLDNLKLMTYEDSKKNLMSLMGIGAKVNFVIVTVNTK